MSLESLLAKLKCDVSSVADVQVSNSRTSRCNGSDMTAVSDVSELALRLDTATPDTARTGCAVSPKSLPTEGCTADTLDTAKRPNLARVARKVGAGETAPCMNIWRTSEPPEHGLFADNRRYCTECRNLSRAGVCRIAEPKTGSPVVARRGYRPSLDMLIRCNGFAPTG
jgi:hypothetical protein